MRKTLVVNAGSSSLKYTLFEMPEYKVIAEGILEKIGLDMGIISIKFNGEKTERELEIPNHEIGIKYMLDMFEEFEVIANYDEITKIGHRVVQGGEVFPETTLIKEGDLEKIKELAKLAPLHNIPNATGIEVFSKLIPGAQNVAVFDTTFHQTMKKEVYTYPVPYEWYEKYDVRKYGAHGTSHLFVSEEMAKKLDIAKEDSKIIVCHLGNGASLSAVKGGKCVQTSMGLTPLAGIMMGTRSGDIDPSILQYIAHQEGLSIDEVTDALNKKSGLLGISGVSSDFRDIKDAIAQGNERAKLALDIYTTRIAETIGSYYIHLGGLDGLVFTAGIGENVKEVRQMVCDKARVLGIELDEILNDTFSDERQISSLSSKISVWIIPTNEEYQIAKEAEQF